MSFDGATRCRQGQPSGLNTYITRYSLFNGDATGSRGHDEQVDNGRDDGEDEETRDDGRRDEEDRGEGRDSAAVDGGDNDGEGEGTKTHTEDEDINWDDAAEGIDEGIEGPEGFRDSDDDDEGRGGDGGATRRRSEIANGPSREGDGGARGGNGDATDDANRGTGDDGDGEPGLWSSRRCLDSPEPVQTASRQRPDSVQTVSRQRPDSKIGASRQLFRQY